MTVDVKEAAEAAVKYLKLLISTAVDINLEEVEIVDNPKGGEQWQITLSYRKTDDELLVYTDVASKLAEAVTGQKHSGHYPRYYRAFTIDAESGQVRSMKIRKL
jgi:hypothetical protein